MPLPDNFHQMQILQEGVRLPNRAANRKLRSPRGRLARDKIISKERACDSSLSDSHLDIVDGAVSSAASSHTEACLLLLPALPPLGDSIHINAYFSCVFLIHVYNFWASTWSQNCLEERVFWGMSFGLCPPTRAVSGHSESRNLLVYWAVW